MDLVCSLNHIKALLLNLLFILPIYSNYYLVTINKFCYLFDGSVTFAEIKAYSELFDFVRYRGHPHPFWKDTYWQAQGKYYVLSFCSNETIPYIDKDRQLSDFQWTTDENDAKIIKVCFKTVYCSDTDTSYQSQPVWYQDPKEMICRRGQSAWIRHKLPHYIEDHNGLRIRHVHIPFRIHETSTIADMKRYYQNVFENAELRSLLHDSWSKTLSIDHFQWEGYDEEDTSDDLTLSIECNEDRRLTRDDYGEYFQIVWMDNHTFSFNRTRLFVQSLGGDFIQVSGPSTDVKIDTSANHTSVGQKEEVINCSLLESPSPICRQLLAYQPLTPRSIHEAEFNGSRYASARSMSVERSLGGTSLLTDVDDAVSANDDRQDKPNGANQQGVAGVSTTSTYYIIIACVLGCFGMLCVVVGVLLLIRRDKE